MTPTGMRLVMLIDDEPAQQRLVSALAARAGWRTIFAADSETAIVMLGTRDGMMLCCWIMPCRMRKPWRSSVKLRLGATSFPF